MIARFTFRWRQLVVACAVLMALCATGASFAQVLDQVPADALGVLKFHNLDQINAKVAALAKQFALNAMAPQMDDPLAFLMAEAKVKAGLDKAGDVALVWANADMIADKPPLIVLVPVTDYKAFVANFAPAEKEGELDKVVFKDADKPAYMANWGTFAAISSAKELLAAKPAGLKLTGMAAKEMATRDAAIFFNLKVLGPKLLSELAKNKDQILEQMETVLAQAPNADPKYAPVIKAVMGQYISIAEIFLRDAQGATYALNLSNDGIATFMTVDLNPASYTGQLVQKLKNTGASLLSGLPNVSYLVYGGAVVDSAVWDQVVTDGVAPIIASIKTLNDPKMDKAVAAYVDSMHQILGLEKSVALGMPMPSGPVGKSSLFQVVGFMEGDAQKILDAQKQGVDVAGDLLGVIGSQGVKASMTYTPNIKTIDGVSFSEIKTKTEVPADQPQAAMMNNMLFGPNGQVVELGVVDAGHLAMAMGVDDKLLGDLVTSSKAKDVALGNAAHVQEVARNLPAKRIAVAYIAVDNIVTAVMNAAAQFNVAIPVKLPENLPPVGVAVASEGAGIRCDTYISNKLVSALISAGMQVWQTFVAPTAPDGPGAL